MNADYQLDISPEVSSASESKSQSIDDIQRWKDSSIMSEEQASCNPKKERSDFDKMNSQIFLEKDDFDCLNEEKIADIYKTMIDQEKNKTTIEQRKFGILPEFMNF